MSDLTRLANLDGKIKIGKVGSRAARTPVRRGAARWGEVGVLSCAINLLRAFLALLGAGERW